MNIRTRKFVGMVASISFLIAYCLFAMVIGALWIADGPRWLHALYYVTAGLAWLPVVMWLIRWMQNEI